MIFFAVEQNENTETAKSERGADDLQNAAADFARAELIAEKGGHTAVSQAEQIAQNPETPLLSQKIMLKGAQKVKDAVNAREKNLTPETTKKLSEAVAELQRKIKNFEQRKFENAAAEAEIKQLSSLPNAKELFKDLKITLSSQTKGSITFEWNPDDKKGVAGFGLEQKKAIAKTLRERLAAPPKGVDASKAVESLRDKFLSNSEVPKSWKDWLKNPEAGFDGASEKQKTLGYVVEWVGKNLPDVVAQSAKFRAISERASANPEAAQKLSEKGVRTSIDDFRELSRTERNEVLGKYAEVLATFDSDLASRAAEAGVSDKVESENIQTKNTAELEKAETEKTAQAEKLAPLLQKFATDQNLAKKAAARERELTETGKEAGAADAVANLRQRAQSAEKVGFGAKLKKLFGRGEKPEAASSENSAENPENGEPKKEDFAARARREIAGETLEDPKNLEDFSNSLGLKNVQKEEAGELAKLLATEKVDAENVRALLSEQKLRQILERRKAENEKKAA